MIYLIGIYCNILPYITNILYIGKIPDECSGKAFNPIAAREC